MMRKFVGRCLTLKRPWPAAFLLPENPKRIENRSWCTSYRGPLALHVGKGWDFAGGLAMRRVIQEVLKQSPPDYAKEDRPGYVGSVFAVCRLQVCLSIPELYCTDQADNPWAFGPFCFMLEDFRRVKPVFLRGMQGLFRVEFDYEEIDRCQSSPGT